PRLPLYGAWLDDSAGPLSQGAGHASEWGAPASGQSIASDIVRADEPLLASFFTRRNLLQTVRADWDYRFARYMNEDPDRSCIYPEVSRVHHTRTPQERAYSTTDTLQADRYAPMAFAGHMDTDAAAPA